MKPSLKVKPETEIQDWSDLLEVPEGVFGCFLSYCWAVYFLYNFFFLFTFWRFTDFKLYTMMYHMYAECEFVFPRGYF